MKKSTPPSAPGKNQLLPQLGNISAQHFLDEYWQKKPLLIRAAFPKKFAPLTKAEILRLAGYDEAECRLITHVGGQWQLDHGPFKRGVFSALAKDAQSKWTVLIQDTQHFSHEAHTLLAHFDFLPQSRVDDLMVSYANKGGGVGPHVDSYDVFLLQGTGQRRWQISSKQDLALKLGMPLKILQRFRAEQEWLLDEGDMLYLPPSFAHHGVAATDDCVTWSIGFRAPSHQELLDAFLDDMRDRLNIDGRFADPARLATDAGNTAAIDLPLQAAFGGILTDCVVDATQDSALRDFIGRYLSQPKSHVTFVPPDAHLSLSAFTRRAANYGVTLDLRTRLLYDEYDQNKFFMNGESLSIAKADRRIFAQLANTRKLDASNAKSASATARAVLHDLWQRGHVQINPA